MHFSDGIRAQPAALARSAAAVTAALADLALGTGLGGVVVVDGRPLPRAHGAAGEIGFLLADRGQLRRPGLMGMEERVGGRVVADCARRLAAEQPDRTVLDPRSAETAHVFPRRRMAMRWRSGWSTRWSSTSP